MSDDGAEDAPWPPDGLPLAQAFWRVVGRPVDTDHMAPNRLSTTDRELLNQFYNAMENERYRGRGRLSSLAAEFTKIPGTAWRYFSYRNMYRSMLSEIETGNVWFDVRISPIGAEQEPKPAPPVEPFRTGAPGRPTAMDHIETEAKRRVKDGEVTPEPGKLTKFGEELAIWWEAKRKEFDPTGPKVASRTIENNLRDYWRNLISKSRKPPP